MRELGWAFRFAAVNLSGLRERPLDAEVLTEATARIMTAVAGLLEQVRAQGAPAERSREHRQAS